MSVYVPLEKKNLDTTRQQGPHRSCLRRVRYARLSQKVGRTAKEHYSHRLDYAFKNCPWVPLCMLCCLPMLSSNCSNPRLSVLGSQRSELSVHERGQREFWRCARDTKDKRKSWRIAHDSDTRTDWPMAEDVPSEWPATTSSKVR